MADDNVFHLRPKSEDEPPLPADGPPAITFGWDDAEPVTFRDRATLDEFVAAALAAPHDEATP